MNPAPLPGTAAKDRRRKVLVRSGLFLLLLCLSLAWLGVTLAGLDALPSIHDCSMREEAHDNPLETFTYRQLLRARFGPRDSAVTLVTIPSTSAFQPALHNTCQARRLIADVFTAVAALPTQPRVIAIDRSYSQYTCADENVNRHFASVIPKNIPVIVGQATQAAGKGDQENCLALTPPFCFTDPTAADGAKCPVGLPNLHTGLVRLNQDTRKIPIGWFVFNPPPESGAQRPSGLHWEPGFAFRVASAFSASPKLMALHGTAGQPYGSTLSEPQKNDIAQVLCGDPAIAEKWKVHCQGVALAPLQNRILMVGDPTETDAQSFWAGEVSGAELHARYVSDLLNGTYLRTLYYWVDFGLVGIYLIAYALLDLKFVVLAKQDQEHKALAIDTLLFLALIAIAAILLYQGYLAPFTILASYAIAILLVGRFLWHYIAKTLKQHFAQEAP